MRTRRDQSISYSFFSFLLIFMLLLLLFLFFNCIQVLMSKFALSKEVRRMGESKYHTKEYGGPFAMMVGTTMTRG